MKTLLKLLAVLLIPATVFVGCEYDDDDDDDYSPPAGFGAILVDNNTADDIEVFIDGVAVGQVSDYTDRVFDATPGVHRVILDGDDTSRDFRDDVDVLDGRLTVLDVEVDGFDDDYDVDISFE